VWNERIAQIPAQKKVIILDACHSGGVEKGKGGAGFMSSLFEQFIAPSAGQATFSSSKRDQTSYEDDESGHGVFTRYLLDTLKGDGDANGDKVITLKEANDYVEGRVRAWGVQKGKVQTPYLESTLTEDVILSIVKPEEVTPLKPEELAPQTFGIRIDTNPQGAKIILNGQDTQKKTPQILPVPQAGTYQIELTRDGYKPYRVNVTLSANQPVRLINTPLQKIDISTPEPTKATGILSVTALIDENRDVQADVYVDGKPVGKTYYENADMPSKTYQLEVRYSELYHPYKETIAVMENETTRVKAILAPAFGSLNVTSEPSNASVDVLDMSDTRQKSGQTPLNISQLPSGTYKLKLEKDRYYYPETQIVNIEDGKTTPVSVPFRPKFGTLVVTSKPPDAEVILNGTPQGKAPLTLERVISGNYTLELHKDQYYYPETRSVKIEDGKTTEASVEFRPRFGTLVIQSDPPDAEIIFDGTPKGKTPLTLERVISNNYTLELRKELYLDWTGNVQIIDGQVTTMPPIPLTPNFGTLEVNYKPEGATVYLNEKMIGNTPLPPVKLKPDTYSLRVTAGDKYRDVSPPVVLANGQTLLLEEELQRLKGGVKVLSNPPDADIYLNGGNLGITPKNMGLTPKVLKELDADDYTLKLTKEGYKNYTQTLRIREGMLPNIDVTLEKIVVELPRRTTPTHTPIPYKPPIPSPEGRGRGRTWLYITGTAVVTGVATGVVYALTRTKTTPVTVVITLPE
jgi:major membrane immunogen (membrane-anchored lipoprotein)